MTHHDEPDTTSSTSSVRQAARAKAAEIRTAQRRKSVLIRIGLILLAVILIAAVVFGVVQSLRNDKQPLATGPANMASGGIVIGKDLVAVRTEALPIAADAIPTTVDPAVPNIRVYADYLSSAAGDFETTNGDVLEKLAVDGTATIEIHPIALLTGKSAGSQYSLRAAAAAGCVANSAPDSFFAFNRALYADQPNEGTSGHDDATLVKKAASAGAGGNEIATCINDGHYTAWVQKSTDRAMNSPVPNSKLDSIAGDLTVLVNDKVYTGSPTDEKEFRAFVLAVASEAQIKGTAEPAASAVPAPTGSATATPAP